MPVPSHPGARSWRSRRSLAALAVAAVATAGAVALAAPAQAFTTRVEMTTHGFGTARDETVELADPVHVTEGSTLRVARKAGYDGFRQLQLFPHDGGESLELFTAKPVPGTTTAWNVGLPGVEAGGYRARLVLVDRSGENSVFYDFGLFVAEGTPAVVKVPLVGSPDTTVRRIGTAAPDSWVLAGSRLTVVAPPGVTFAAASVKVGVVDGEGGAISTPAPDDLAVTRVGSGTSLQFRVPANVSPTQPITRRTRLGLTISVPDQLTDHGVGTLLLQADLDVDPVGTPWSAPEGIGPEPTDHLYGGHSLTRMTSLISANGRYRLAMQGNSNLVLWKGSKVLWQTGQRGAAWTELNGDGNLIQRDATGAVVWQTARYGARGEALMWLQNDGNLVIYGADERVVWQTGTAGR